MECAATSTKIVVFVNINHKHLRVLRVKKKELPGDVASRKRMCFKEPRDNIENSSKYLKSRLPTVFILVFETFVEISFGGNYDHISKHSLLLAKSAK